MNQPLVLIQASELEQMLTQTLRRELENLKPTPAPPIAAPNRLLPLEEASRMLGICRASLYKLIRAGGIETLKVGHRRLIAQSEINQFITQTKTV